MIDLTIIYIIIIVILIIYTIYLSISLEDTKQEFKDLETQKMLHELSLREKFSNAEANIVVLKKINEILLSRLEDD